MNEKNTSPAPAKDRILDLTGSVTGFAANKRNILWLCSAVLIVVLFALIGPAIGLPDARSGMVLGLIFACIVLWASNIWDPGFVILLFAFGGLGLGIFSYSDLTTSMAGSMFIPIASFFIVAYGADSTPIAKRLAYLILKVLGGKQSLVVLALSLGCAILSAFCSNFASTVVIAAIAVGIVREIEAVSPDDGKKIGKAIMLLLPTASCVGGAALVNGCPGVNGVAIAAISAASDSAVNLDYNTWASLGIPLAVIAIVPISFIYIKCAKVSNNASNVDKTYYDGKLKELGKMGGSEIRWLVIVVCMVVALVSGIPMTIAPPVCAVIAMCPFIGFIKPSEAIKRLPMSLLLLFLFANLFSIAFSNYGLTAWLGGLIAPLISDIPVFLLMLICSIIMMIAINLFVNATVGIITIFLSLFTSIVMAAGLNPAIVLFPCAITASLQSVLSVQAGNLVTRSYGYFEGNDTVLPGTLAAVLWAVLATAVSYVFANLYGYSFYL